MNTLPEINPEVDLVVLTVTGQGAQNSKMTKPFRDNPTYKPLLEKFENLTGVNPREDFGEDLISTNRLIQPANVLVNIMSIMALERAGVKPQIAMGHSLGEIGAAYAAGAISAENAVTLGVHRGETTSSVLHNVSEKFRIKTAMFPLVLKENVHLPEDLWPYIRRVSTEILNDFKDKKSAAGEKVKIWKSEATDNPDEVEYEGEHFLDPANSNSRVQGIISGTKETVDHLVANMPDIFRRQRPLAVEGAFHSVAMSSGKKLYRPYVLQAGIESPSKSRLISPTTVSELTTKTAIESMLVNQLVQPVLYVETQHELLLGKLLGEYAVERMVVFEAGPAQVKHLDNPSIGVLTNINRDNIGTKVKRPQDGKEIPVEYYRVSTPL